MRWLLVVVLLFDCLLGEENSSEQVMLQCWQDIIKETKQKAPGTEDEDRERCWKTECFFQVLVGVLGMGSFSCNNGSLPWWNGSFPWWNGSFPWWNSSFPWWNGSFPWWKCLRCKQSDETALVAAAWLSPDKDWNVGSKFFHWWICSMVIQHETRYTSNLKSGWNYQGCSTI